ncbi:MAG: phage Gp37/Gp68 family protein [Firmicutes bacterium]|nr:phage Gp37/Gp68 family protein [Bacillota bacterium]
MATQSHIEWTDATWNPVTGCTKISQGCKHCYAERMARRLQAMGALRYVNGFRVTLHPEVLGLPLRWVKPRRIFVNSMSDVFHPDVPEPFVEEIFSVMVRTPQHTYQILTKRPERLARMADRLPFPPNVWVGTSVESQDVLQRIDWLRMVPAHVRFLSCEPLLGPLPNLPLEGIHWVIVGGESGPRARPMKREWVLDIRDQCLRYEIPFFFKQWGGVQRRRAGRLLDGRTWDQFPDRLEPEMSSSPV